MPVEMNDRFTLRCIALSFSTSSFSQETLHEETEAYPGSFRCHRPDRYRFGRFSRNVRRQDRAARRQRQDRRDVHAASLPVLNRLPGAVHQGQEAFHDRRECNAVPVDRRRRRTRPGQDRRQRWHAATAERASPDEGLRRRPRWLGARSRRRLTLGKNGRMSPNQPDSKPLQRERSPAVLFFCINY